MTEIIRTNILLRRPVLMEDEGIYHPVLTFDSFDELNKWMDENTGYFVPSDFVWTGVGGPGVNRFRVPQLRELFNEHRT